MKEPVLVAELLYRLRFLGNLGPPPSLRSCEAARRHRLRLTRRNRLRAIGEAAQRRGCDRGTVLGLDRHEGRAPGIGNETISTQLRRRSRRLPLSRLPSLSRGGGRAGLRCLIELFAGWRQRRVSGRLSPFGYPMTVRAVFK